MLPLVQSAGRSDLLRLYALPATTFLTILAFASGSSSVPWFSRVGHTGRWVFLFVPNAESPCTAARKEYLLGEQTHLASTVDIASGVAALDESQLRCCISADIRSQISEVKMRAEMLRTDGDASVHGLPGANMLLQHPCSNGLV